MGDPAADLREDLPAKQVHLIRATYRLMGEKGTHGLTLQDVADAAGVSKAVIVYYFKSKENLVLATMRWVLGQVADRIRSAIDGVDDPEAKVTAMVNAIFVDARRNRNFYLAYVNLVDHSARLDRFNELSGTFRTIVHGTYAEVVTAGVEAGAFADRDPREAAMVVRAIIDGLFLQWLEEPDWERTHAAYREVCIRALLSYLRSPTASPRAPRPSSASR